MEPSFGDSDGTVNAMMHCDILAPFVTETLTNLDSMADLKAHSDLLPYRGPLDGFVFKGFSVGLAIKQHDGGTGKLVMIHDLNSTRWRTDGNQPA